jgi:hypothetical protein
MTGAALVYKLLAAAVDWYDPRSIDELVVEEVMLRKQGLCLNTEDGRQYRVVVTEVLRP